MDWNKMREFPDGKVEPDQDPISTVVKKTFKETVCMIEIVDPTPIQYTTH